MNILVTGGCGYIGSHVCVELLNSDHNVTILDNCCNSDKAILNNIQKITHKKSSFYEIDILDEKSLIALFCQQKIDAVIHLAGLKSVEKSVQSPLLYYENHLSGTLSLLSAMQKSSVKHLVFSSSATVYGNPDIIPIPENAPFKSATCPYGKCKQIVETILNDLYKADPTWNICILRYFNPAGAHPSGLIGEQPKNNPDNLIPYITRVAQGVLPYVNIYGGDYPTADGTGIRDYIHIMDLVYGHIITLKKNFNHPGIYTYNLGTGYGISVMEVIKTFEQVTRKKIPWKIMSKRAGDVAVCYADPTKARQQLGWQAKYSLTDIVKDAWQWQLNNC